MSAFFRIADLTRNPLSVPYVVRVNEVMNETQMLTAQHMYYGIMVPLQFLKPVVIYSSRACEHCKTRRTLR